MALKATPFALPVADLEKPDGSVTPSSALHAGGPTLVMIGHLNCKTSKQTLPFIAQIHKDGGRAVTMLQDSPENAAAGLAKLERLVGNGLEVAYRQGGVTIYRVTRS